MVLLRCGHGFGWTDVEYGGEHSDFNVPYSAVTQGGAGNVVLPEPEGGFAPGPASTSPMAIVIDRRSAQVRAEIARPGWPGGSRDRR